MNKTWETKLQRFWILVSVISLLMPLILSGLSVTTEVFTNIMTITIGVIFALSFPTSICALPFLALFKLILEMEVNTLFTTYFYLILLNIIGYVQYFRILPAFFGTSKSVKFPTILEN